MKNYYIKTNRIFTPIRRFIWILTPLVALGGLFEKKLGLLIPPIMLALVIMSFFRGRYWCGNFCSHGSFYDKYIIKLSKNQKVYNFLKSKITQGLFFSWFMFSFTKKIIAAVNAFGSDMFLDRLGFAFTSAYLMVLIVGSGINILNSTRSWCNICPMGIMQKGSYGIGKILKVTRKTDKLLTICDKNMCHECGKCARVCPMQLTPYREFDEKNRFNSNECIKCGTCVENCPGGVLDFVSNKDFEKKVKDKLIRLSKSTVPIVDSIIVQINDIGKDVKEIVFKVEKNMEYIPGQFILVKIQDNPIQYRAYSIVTYDSETRLLKIAIKKVKKGYGTEIIFNDFHIGRSVELKGPMGRELILDKDAQNILFIGNGIGVTPFVDLSKVAIETRAKNIIFLYGARSEEDLFYKEHFEEIQKRDNRFKYIPVLSREESDRYKKGYVTNEIQNIKDIKQYKIYVCGSLAMASDLNIKLKDLGVNESNIFMESI